MQKRRFRLHGPALLSGCGRVGRLRVLRYHGGHGETGYYRRRRGWARGCCRGGTRGAQSRRGCGSRRVRARRSRGALDSGYGKRALQLLERAGGRGPLPQCGVRWRCAARPNAPTEARGRFRVCLLQGAGSCVARGIRRASLSICEQGLERARRAAHGRDCLGRPHASRYASTRPDMREGVSIYVSRTGRWNTPLR